MVVDSGTSFAAAIVSGSLTLLEEASGASVKACTNALIQAAQKSSLGGLSRNPKRWGEGPLDVRAALQLLILS
jgi:hypothetical protein